MEEARRNLLPETPLSGEWMAGKDLIIAQQETHPSFGHGRSVTMLSASSQGVQGFLTDGPSRLLLGPGKRLVRTFILSLGKNGSR